MASTYTPTDALTICDGVIRQMAIPATQTTVLIDIAHSHLWKAKPDWQWTTAALTAVSLADATQDYAISNTDVYRFLRFRITQTDCTPNRSRDLDPAESLEPDLNKRGMEDMKNIAWMPAIAKLRLESAMSVTGSQVFQLGGEYQRTPTKITASLLGTVFAFPDHMLGLFVEGLTYQLFRYANDARAGAVQITKGGDRQYTGQLGVYMTKLREEMEAEDVSSQQFRFPSESLGLGRNSWPGTMI